MNEILCGDAFDMIETLDDNSVQSIITSPPYWGLRDYGVVGQIGLEQDFHEYLNKIVTLFDKCKRVLKNDGLLFVNLGDTYYGGGNNRGNSKTLSLKQRGNRGGQGQVNMQFDYKLCSRKSMVGIPQRFMIMMIDNGWICRNQIIWRKPNAMPSSVKDRFSMDYEVIYMFSKKTKYKFNQQFEQMKTNDMSNPRGSKGALTLNSGLRGEKSKKENKLRNMRSVWDINNKPLREAHFATFPEDLVERMILCSTDENDIVFDPFIGSGTVAKVALMHNRNFIGIELNKEFVDIANNRLKQCELRIL